MKNKKKYDQFINFILFLSNIDALKRSKYKLFLDQSRAPSKSPNKDTCINAQYRMIKQI